MRIAYICTDPGVPVFGRKGCSVHVQEIIRAWRKRGDHVELFAARVGGESPPDLVDLAVHELTCPTNDDPREREWSLLAANDAIGEAIAAAGRFDLVYERHALWNYAAMEHARDAGIPGVLEVNAPLVEEQRKHRRLFAVGTAERAARRAFSAARVVATVSDAVADYVRGECNPADHVHVVENGVDPGRFADSLADDANRNRLFTIGFVGTMKAWHGLEALIDAFSLLHAELPEARLILVGDGPETPVLQRQLANHGSAVCKAVCFVGAVDPADVPKWLRRMDVAVACPPHIERYYFSPLKVFEYMAAGLPVVASRVGQIPSIVGHDVAGLLCEPGNVGEIVESLRRLARQPELRRRLGATGRQRVVEHHTWQAVVDRIAGLATTGEGRSSRDHRAVQKA
ncbi:MAG: glycosyltransferase family 4 protein [Planctomycetaceae bacterium]|nr:glycosyltransferase family 4 protein [Planctomycetaceae bacterium]